MQYKITVQEVVKHNHEWTIEVSNDVDIDEILDHAGENKTVFTATIEEKLTEQGVTIVDVSEDEDGEIDSVEITDSEQIDSPFE